MNMAARSKIAGVITGMLVGTVLAGGVAQQAAASPHLEAGKSDIYRDEWGVPHIYAATEADGFYALGYAQAEDQLQRFLLMVTAARGELAAHVTPDDLAPQLRALLPSVDHFIESDYQAKLWRLRELSVPAAERLDPQLQKNYAGFLAGVRAYMRAHPDKVPSWAPAEIAVADLVAVPHFMLWSSYQAGIGLLDCGRAGVTIKTAHAQLAAPPSGYSNQWAVMPARTATGGAILLSDPHGGIDGRFVHEYRLHAGRIALAGFASGPLPIVSRNANLGWALTTGSPDVADCYRVRTTSSANDAYLFDGDTRSIEKREITIHVKDGRVLKIPAAYTRHNGVLSPVVAEEAGLVHVVSTPYVNNLEGLHNSYYRMSLAQTVDAFRDALGAGGMFPQNLMAADTRGDIFYIHAGYVPVRHDPSLDWTHPVDGNTAKTAWAGMHPITDLPTVKSPAAGFLQNNNVDLRFMDRTLHPEFRGLPEYLLSEGWIPRDKTTTRAVRAIAVLSETSAMTETDAFAMAFDTKTALAKPWLALLGTAVSAAAKPVPPEDGSFLRDLMAFDGEMVAASTAALKYVYWREALRDLLVAEDIDELADAFDRNTAVSPALNGRMIQAVSDARARLERAGGLGRTYGDEFRLAGRQGRTWPLSGGSLELLAPVPGKVNECGVPTLLCDTTLFPFSHVPTENNVRIAVSGSRMMRLDFYRPDGIRSFTVQNPGISDDDASVHADDQAERLLSKKEMKPVRFDWSELEPHIVSRKRLTVRLD